MRKLIVTAILTLFSFTSANADLGVNVGISGQMGLFAASATETDTGTDGTTSGADEKNSESEYLGIGWGSVFIEKTLGRAFIGIDYVPSALETDSKEERRADLGVGVETQTVPVVENKIQVDFEDLTTYYLGFNVNDNLYAKAGIMTVDIITNENLGTGSTYGNTDMDGMMFGVGYNATNDSGLFLRVEGNYMEFDGASLKSANSINKISLDSLDGVSGKLSVGKSF
tara:strand:- start:67 stop:747 length:681 start_codon:yes stop_codon:yes gene_type:complete